MTWSLTDPSYFILLRPDSALSPMHQLPDPEQCEIKGMLSSCGRVDEAIPKTLNQIIRLVLASADSAHGKGGNKSLLETV